MMAAVLATTLALSNDGCLLARYDPILSVSFSFIL